MQGRILVVLLGFMCLASCDHSPYTQVFVYLLRACQPEVRKALVRESLDVLIPVLDKRMAAGVTARAAAYAKRRTCHAYALSSAAVLVHVDSISRVCAAKFI